MRNLDKGTAVMLADMMDECSDRGQWNGADLCDALGSVIAAAGGFKSCDEHGLFSASNSACPWCREWGATHRPRTCP